MYKYGDITVTYLLYLKTVLFIFIPIEGFKRGGRFQEKKILKWNQ